jgi:predicted N-formylglutamate amidohydrolase
LQDKPLRITITCEHGGNVFPKQFSALFHDRKELLESHRGHDPGALDLAKKLARGLKAPLFFSEITRLLIDPNRSPDNPKRFSEITNSLNAPEKAVIQKLCYQTYRTEVESGLSDIIRKSGVALHISVHTFTPVLRGKVRSADIGLLYDPSRKAETSFCLLWQAALGRLNQKVQTRRNYPYRGTSDGFTAYLRKRFPENSYLGIELEVNQKYLSGDRETWLYFQQLILKTLRMTICINGKADSAFSMVNFSF